MKLVRKNLPILICTASCPNCKAPIDDYPMFESGPGGDFATVKSKKSGELYRIDLNLVNYLNITLAECLQHIAENEGGIENIMRIPEELSCKICNQIFHATEGQIISEKHLETYSLEP